MVLGMESIEFKDALYLRRDSGTLSASSGIQPVPYSIGFTEFIGFIGNFRKGIGTL